jgi:glycosyltransferase involved in cell wall biosynthesis
MDEQDRTMSRPRNRLDGAGAEHDERAEETLAAVSVVLPVYNEEACVDRCFEVVHQYAKEAKEYEFIWVDDGSTDQTARRLSQRIAERGCERIRLISYARNEGKGFAIKTGFAKSRGGVVVFTDGDLAYSLDHLAVMVEALRDCDVVIGSRRLADDGRVNPRGLVRKVLGEGFNRLARAIVGLPYRDTQAGLKGFRREAAEKIFPRQRIEGYSTDVEMLFLAKRLGFKVGEIAARVCHQHTTKPSSVSLWRDPPRMLRDMLLIRFHALCRNYDE